MKECKSCDGVEWAVMVIDGVGTPWVCPCVKQSRRLAVAQAGVPASATDKAAWLTEWHRQEADRRAGISTHNC